MKRKKKAYKIIPTVSLVITALLSVDVFAQTFVEKKIAGNDYANLAQIADLIKISDTCLNKNIIVNSFYGADTVDGIFNLRASLYFRQTTNSVYSNYLDNENPKDGAAWCQDFFNKTPLIVKEPIQQIVSSIDGGLTSDSVGNMICGRENDNTGLLSVTFRYTDSNGIDQILTEDVVRNGDVEVPDWIQVDSSGHPKNCKKALKEIRSLSDYYFGDGLYFNLTSNENFSFSEYYSEEMTMDIATATNVASEKLYLDVTKKADGENICYIKQVDKSTYDKLGEPKYAIRNPSGPKDENSSATEYWVPDSSKKDSNTLKFNSSDYGSGKGGWNTTNIRPDITSSDMYSCKEAMEKLAEYSDSGALDVNNIKNCYENARENRDTLKKIYTKLQTVSGTYYNHLIEIANYLAEDKEIPSYTDGSGKHTPFIDNGTQIYYTIVNDATLSKSASAKEFANLSKEFGSKVSTYNDERSSEGSLSDAAISDLESQISAYTSARDTFKKDIVDKVGKTLRDLPEVNLDSMYKDGVVQTEVENFYKIDEEGNLTCIYNDKVQEVVNKVEDIIGATIDFKEYTQSQTDDNGTSSSDSDPCYDAGIEGMSWILCPVVNNSTNTVDSFEGALKTLLSIDSNALFGDGVAYNIWEVFRNIANAILIIVFLVIIFSQLTGYGIDNYGIKKMLPKLIVMGVLINLSYIICELAVDLSNILGVGLNNLFEGIAGGAGVDTSNAGSVVAIVLVVLGAAATTAASGYLSGGGAGIIVALVLALISAIVALLIFLAMVGIRMIIVIVFTVISPVAFALYILLNTQNLFKKWWKVFEAALVVYPICGALYGAHFIIKAILSGHSNIFMNIAAIIAPFLPFFALPSLLKGAMAGLGSVAGAITAAGSTFRKGAQEVTGTAKTAVEGSARYSNSKERAQERRVQRRAGLNSKGEEIKMGRIGRFMRGGERGIARARAQYVKDMEARNRENAIMNGGFDAAMAGAEAKADAQRVADIEALLTNNKVSGVNVNDAGSVGTYHARAISDYQTATTEADRTVAMARIKAAQNILSKTDPGRAEVQKNLEDAARNDRGKGLSQAASHLLSAYGDKYKSANRGAHKMIADMATAGDADGDILSTELGKIKSRIDNNSYSMYGVDKYTEESLANADMEAISRLRDSVVSERMTDANKETIQETVRRALEKADSGNLNIKPEVRKELEKIRDHGATSPRTIGFSGQ